MIRQIEVAGTNSMQLPTSISSFSTTNPVYPNRPSQPIEKTAEESPKRQQVESLFLESTAESQQLAQAQVERPAVVEQPARSELSAQDTVTRQQSGSGNPSVDQYQRIASQGGSNAPAQDPSLFRVDVYV
ncbi:MAG: hypothetical protein P8X74_09705 [Reinekea sp.]